MKRTKIWSLLIISLLILNCFSAKTYAELIKRGDSAFYDGDLNIDLILHKSKRPGYGCIF